MNKNDWDCMDDDDFNRKDDHDFRRKCECVKTPSCAKCEKLHPCPKPVLLVCGQGVSCELERGYKRDKTECAFVEIDTTCLCNPVVKIDFCANIFAKVRDRRRFSNRAKLEFKLVKVCENGAFTVIGKWFFERDLDSIRRRYYSQADGALETEEENLEDYEIDETYDSEEDFELDETDEQSDGRRRRCRRRFHILTTQDSFCFTTCECQTCPGCCIYKVIVEDKSGRFADIDIKDVQINAIAQSKC